MKQRKHNPQNMKIKETGTSRGKCVKRQIDCTILLVSDFNVDENVLFSWKPPSKNLSAFRIDFNSAAESAG